MKHRLTHALVAATTCAVLAVGIASCQSQSTAKPARRPHPSPTPIGTPIVFPPPAVLARDGGIKVIELAYNRFFDEYVEPVDAPALLGAAWQGMRPAADAEGRALPPAPDFPADRAAAFETFRTAYVRFVSGAQTPRFYRYSAILGMATSLNDCHTFYIAPVLAESLGSTLDDESPSIGVNLSGTPPRIIELVQFGAADTAGLLVGDELVTIDGVSATDLRPDEALLLLSGDAGEKVALQVRRGGPGGQILDFSIARGTARFPNVESRVVSGIGYIRIRAWSSHGISKQVQDVLDRLDRAKINKLIIDLRDNPGGYIDVDTMSLFVPAGVLVRERAHGGRIEEESAYGGAHAAEPTVVLINGGSASSSEFFAVALHEHALGHLIGEQSSGCIGSTYIAPTGDGAILAVTHARALGPVSNVPLTAGIMPDETVGRSIDDIVSGADTQLDAAVAYLNRE